MVNPNDLFGPFPNPVWINATLGNNPIVCLIVLYSYTPVSLYKKTLILTGVTEYVVATLFLISQKPILRFDA